MRNGIEDDEIIIGIQKKSNATSKKKRKSKEKIKKGAITAPKTKKNANIKKKEKKNNIRSFKSYEKTSRLRRLKIFFILVALIVVIMLILSSRIFNIQNINVVNNSIISAEEIINLSKIGVGENIFKIRKSSAIEAIKENAYIESVEISRKLPNTLEISVKERIRKYVLQFADSYVYINNQGYMLEISTEKLDLPIITGFKTDLSNIKAGDRLDVEDLKKLDTVIKIVETANVNNIGNLITKIDISNSKNYIVELASENKSAYLGDCSNLNTRMLLLKTIIEQEKGNAGTAYINIDLNTGRVYFRPST